MEKKYDIAVIGAGPAGSMAAWSAALQKKSVCLIERKSQVGVPVRCGEGIGHKGLVSFIEPRPEWIKATIKRSSMISPNGTKVTVNNEEKSYILDRVKMDGDLAQEAKKAGATLFLNTPVVHVQKKDLMYECQTPDFSIYASIVIIADGVESRLARDLGWNTVLDLEDIESCAFATVTSPLIESEECVFYTGENVAPGGYAWIFPKGVGIANVGLGVLGSKSSAGKAQECLMSFIDRELPGGRISNVHCGGVPVTKAISPLVKEGVMLVGDAARQVNAISGAGIAYSLFAGKTAGKIAAEAIKGSNVDFKHLGNYEKQWNHRFGKQQKRSFALKKFICTIDDAFLDRVAGALSKENPEKINYFKVFAKALSGHPLLILKAFRLFVK